MFHGEVVPFADDALIVGDGRAHKRGREFESGVLGERGFELLVGQLGPVAGDSGEAYFRVVALR